MPMRSAGLFDHFFFLFLTISSPSFHRILTDKKITDIKSCLEVIDLLHMSGVEHVVLTSVTFAIKDVQDCCRSGEGESSITVPSESQEGGQEEASTALFCVCSSASSTDAKPRAFAIGFPTYDGYFTGTGDLFSALLVARLDEALNNNKSSSSFTTTTAATSSESSSSSLPPLARACLKVVATMKAVVLRTYLAQQGTQGRSLDRTQQSASQSVKQCELRLIQSKNEIENPDLSGVCAIEISSS
jgi:pyridoxine kinase